MPANYATDTAYGSEPAEELTRAASERIQLDEHIGAEPQEEMKGDTECLTCGLCAWACVCSREGA